ncbi:hypothetical protein HER21_43175, partial [Pseudomonas sp. BGM005]|nr:hypothetical protein [Pseudomonas sp. BG5]
PIEVATQHRSLTTVDAALVRLPLDDRALAAVGLSSDAVHVIPLYDELPVVVASIESHLLAADELTRADLAGEVVMTLSDDALVPFEVPDSVA